MLGPGFRFHPTDEELVRYYLRRKIFGKAFRFDAISEVDIYKNEPWDLPHMSKLKTRDLEWYFFSLLDKKYGNGSRTNRATEKGYWKTTGKDRAVYHKTQIVGMKKTLVYHCGRAPKGERSNWVMHEYKLADSELETAGISQDTFVLCRVFQKSGSGPKNGEKYGAPLVEEDWDADELELTPLAGAIGEVEFGLDGHDIEQILASDVLLNAGSIQQYPDVSYVGETVKSFDRNRNRLVPSDDYQCCVPNQFDDKNMYTSPGDSNVLDYLLDSPYLDSFDNHSNPVDTDTTARDMLEEYLLLFGANDDTSQYLGHDPAMMFGSDDLMLHPASLTNKDMVDGTETADLPGGQLIGIDNRNTTSSSNKQEKAKYHPDSQHEFIKRASQMLGGKPAPPALAAEFPSKDAVIRLNSILPSSNHVRVNNAYKHDNFNITVCFGFSRGDDGYSSLESSVSIRSGKTTASSVFRCWVCFVLFWVLFLSMSFRLGTYIHAN